MIDPKNQTLNGALALHAVKVLTMFNRVLKALVINKDRALEELNSDWTASQEVADRLMKEYGVPFRIGHHAASTLFPMLAPTTFFRSTSRTPRCRKFTRKSSKKNSGRRSEIPDE